MFHKEGYQIIIITFLITVAAYFKGFDPSQEGLQLYEKVSWLPDLGLTWSVGADGLSMPLILLTSFITSLAVLAAWPVSYKPKLFFFLILAMDGGQIAVFAVQDMMLFFLAWELELFPVYLFLAIWGGKKRQYAATKFILYTALASLLILISGLALALSGGDYTLNINELTSRSPSGSFGLLCYLGFLVGFGARWAGGCTSGHAISGLSNLQLPSLIAVIGFFIGGLTMTFLIFPIIF